MATEKQANVAREAVSDQLFELGAHAVAVDVVSKGKPDAFAVIAYVPAGHKAALPKDFTIQRGKQLINVPIVVKRSEPFKPE